ncbi:MAG: transposase [Gammaproteobacteria bacterium]|nr:transposase [Gammaproteobacteria bacterium]
MHAYCLVTNHVHLLATPLRDDAVSNAMKVVGSRYAQYINLRYTRTGTLLEGRHRASLVQAERGYTYRELFRYQLSEADLHLIRKAAHYCQPVGDDRFRLQIESRYGIQSGQMHRGRPRRVLERE